MLAKKFPSNRWLTKEEKKVKSCGLFGDICQGFGTEDNMMITNVVLIWIFQKAFVLSTLCTAIIRLVILAIIALDHFDGKPFKKSLDLTLPN